MGGVVGVQYISVSLLQFENALLPIDVTFLGIIICVKLLHPENVETPIFVILLLMIAVVRFVQPWYLQPIITQYFIDNKSEIWLLFLIAHSKR